MISSLLLVASLQSAPARAPLPDPYAELLQLYVTGEPKTALARLPLLPDGILRDARARIERDVDARQNLDRAEAAVMMHTELVIAQGGGTARAVVDKHLPIAKRIVGALFSAGRGAFVRDWYLLMSAYFQYVEEYGTAGAYAAEARDRFRDDPQVLLASGALHEQQARLGTGRAPRRDGSGGYMVLDAGEELRRASAYYTRALSHGLGVDAAEARLRRGRVAHVLGDRQAAERDLEEAIATAADPSIEYLGLVFLGSVKEDLGRRGEAALLYARAVAVRPDGHIVFIALANLYSADGQPDEAARMVDRLFRPAEPFEPWWSYQRGQSWHVEGRLVRLRARVQRQ